MNGWLTSGSLKIGGERILFLCSWNGLGLVALTGLLVWTTELGCAGVGTVVPGMFTTMTSYNGFFMHTASVTPVKYGVKEDLSNWGSTNGSINEDAPCFLTSELGF